MSVELVKELRERTGLGMMECKKALAAARGDVEKAIEELRKSSGMKAAKKAGRTAAEGVVSTRVAEDGSYGCIVEVNCETDFAARDEGFLGFVDAVADAAFSARQADISALMKEGALQSAREALVQKIGENISPRRVAALGGKNGIVGAYIHSNSRIAVLVQLKGGDASLAKDVAMHIAASSPTVVSPKDMPEDFIQKEREIFSAQAEGSGKPPEIIEKMVAGRIKKFLAENSLLEQPFVRDPEQTVGQLTKAQGAEVLAFVRFEVGEGIERDTADFASEVAAQLKG